MAKSSALKDPLRPADGSEKQAIIQAVSEYAHELQAPELSALSSNTVVEALEANPSGVFKTDQTGFKVVANVYVTLTYDKDTSIAESFPALVTGHLREGNVEAKIDNVEIDTTSFYE